ncbi:MAG: EamA family transporter [Calditrichaeota bacterium]|nr:EamA family transporter [Calditrichota bacterium]
MDKKSRIRKYLPVLVVALLSLIWSSTWLAIKIGLESMPPFLSAGWRFLIAFVPLLAFSLKMNRPIPKDWRTHLFFIGFSLINFTGGYALVYWGEQYINSGLASVLFSVMPFYVALFSIKLLPSEQITFKKMIGILIGFAGVVIIFHDQLKLSHPYGLYGMIAVLISPGFSAIGTIVGKKARSRFHPVTLNTFPILYTAITLFAIHFMFEQGQDISYDLKAILSLLYLGFMGTALAFVFYFWLLKTTSAILMSLITFITPPMALFWGWLILGEPITLQLVLGMIIILAGIGVVSKSSG